MSNPINFPAAIIDINNNGQYVVTVIASGGVPPYQYRIGSVGYQDSPIFILSDLPNGELPVYVKDSTNADNYIDYSIPNLIIQVSFTYNSTSFTIVASGGYPPYSYSVNGSSFGSNATFNLQSTNVYSVSVIDSTELKGAAVFLLPASNQ